MHPAQAFEIKKQAANLNDLYSWEGCDEVGLEQKSDGFLSGSSPTTFVADAEMLHEFDSLESAGDMEALVDVLCELSRNHEVDWEIRHDYEPDVIGYIREGIADIEVLEELETIRTIGEMLGDFDDVELADVISPADYLADILEPEDAAGPRLLKFPGID